MRRTLPPNESVRNVPPLSKQKMCHCNWMIHYIHILVPWQIENTAKSLGLPHKVYGDFWLIKGGCEDCQKYSNWENTRVFFIVRKTTNSKQAVMMMRKIYVWSTMKVKVCAQTVKPRTGQIITAIPRMPQMMVSLTTIWSRTWDMVDDFYEEDTRDMSA